jgi:hypothetical protein
MFAVRPSVGPMAINPELDNSGALALTPSRVNIFAKPDAAAGERSSRPQPKTIFDPAATCKPGEGDDRRGTAASRWAHRANARARRGGIARLAGLIGLALVIAVLALRPAERATSDRSDPRAREHQTTPRAPGARSRHVRAKDATRRPRTRKRAKPHRAPRPHPTRARVPTRPTPRPVPVRPRPAPSLPAPRPTAPARPLPERVPRSAPPEFM